MAVWFALAFAASGCERGCNVNPRAKAIERCLQTASLEHNPEPDPVLRARTCAALIPGTACVTAWLASSDLSAGDAAAGIVCLNAVCDALGANAPDCQLGTDVDDPLRRALWTRRLTDLALNRPVAPYGVLRAEALAELRRVEATPGGLQRASSSPEEAQLRLLGMLLLRVVFPATAIPRFGETRTPPSAP